MNKTIRITVPASTSNLGVGFDSLGLALTLYNSFEFVRSDHLQFEGFDLEDSNVENLVYQSFKSVFDELRLSTPTVKISQKLNQVPKARGLGSSSTCIVAGMLAANQFLEEELSEDVLFRMIAKMEGHPDNAVAAMFGGLWSIFAQGDDYMRTPHDISSFLHFTLFIPPFEVSTKMAREKMPKLIPLQDVVHDLSRAFTFPFAMSEGDLELLAMIVKDRIHEPYRYPLIDGGLNLKSQIEELGGIALISGSGSTILGISTESDFSRYFQNDETVEDWIIEDVDFDLEGAFVEVLR